MTNFMVIFDYFTTIGLHCITKCSHASRSHPVLRFFEAMLNYAVGREGGGRGNANA